jgi:hypothetical protein
MKHSGAVHAVQSSTPALPAAVVLWLTSAAQAQAAACVVLIMKACLSHPIKAYARTQPQASLWNALAQQLLELLQLTETGCHLIPRCRQACEHAVDSMTTCMFLYCVYWLLPNFTVQASL